LCGGGEIDSSIVDFHCPFYIAMGCNCIQEITS
jgi:hypothetical protein